MANAIVEVAAPRDITRQLLRHRSFCFQEFSQRYSDEIEFTDREFRRQDDKNRQNSVDDLHESLQNKFEGITETLAWEAERLYKNMRQHSIAKECARVVLPEGLTMSKLYVNGTVRSWLHYLDVREDHTTQYEHQLLAREIRKVLEPAFPTIFKVNNNAG
jgi:thymidylate synthase (FAD)